MQIPNCIHSNRLNILAQVLRDFTFDNKENIKKILETCRTLTSADCVVYKTPEKTGLKTKEIFCKEKKCNLNEEVFDKLCNYDVLVELNSTCANMNENEKCFYYSSEFGTNNKLNEIFMEHGIKYMIISLISNDINDGIICAIFKTSIAITRADMDTVSFIGSIIKTEEKNYSMYLKLKYRMSFENLLTQLATRFSELPNNKMYDAINQAIEELGTFLKIDRTYLYRIDVENREFKKEFEWAAPGIKSWKKDVLTKTQYDWILNNIRKYDIMVLDNIDKSDVPLDLKEFLKERNVKTLLLIPIITATSDSNLKSNLQGFFGFSCECIGTEWSAELKSQMKIVSYMLGTALKRMEIAKETKSVEDVISNGLDQWTKERKEREQQHAALHAQLSSSLKMLQSIANTREKRVEVTN